MKATIARPFYDWDGRKYLEMRVEDGTLLRVKVPWRYGRVMCRVEGIRPIQELELGESVIVEIETKMWDGQKFLVLKSIESQGMQTQGSGEPGES